MTLKPVGKVSEVVERFANEFAAFAGGFVSGRYAFWLGSAISRDRMPDVWRLLEKVVDFVRLRACDEGVAGPHWKALKELCELAGFDVSVVDLSRPCATWPGWSSLAERLVDKYDHVLNVPVGTEPDDYLVWTGLDVPGTYADPSKQPDVEHYCVVLLLLEGVVTTAVTANWDGLIEKALGELAERPDAEMRVIVRPEDFREKSAPAELIKFHGCAVMAASKPDEYRKRLIARNPQIQGWKAANPHTASELEQRFSVRDTLMIGLSTQDANMHQMFSTASTNLAREWKPGRPAVVLSEQSLRQYHRTVLTTTYSNYGPQNRDAIADGAVLGAYAKPVLVGLVVWTLTEKLAELIDQAPMPDVADSELALLKSSLRLVRDEIAAAAGEGTLTFVQGLIDAVGTTLHVFRTGMPPISAGIYEPISSRPITQAVGERHFPSAQLGQLAVVLSLVGRGLQLADWTVRPGGHQALANGVLHLESMARSIRLFIVKDADAWVTLMDLDEYDDDDASVLVLFCGSAPLPSRGVRGRRSGKVGARHLRIADVCADAASADDLYAEFKQAGGFA